MIKVGIAGITGYAGVELLKCLSQHPEVEIVYAGSESAKGNALNEVFPFWPGEKFAYLKDLKITGLSPKAEEGKAVGIKENTPDIVFTALPHGLAMDTVAEWLDKGSRVIDLSADYRLKNWETYTKWYEQEHTHKSLLEKAVYGLSEINKDQIKEAELVANPGCFPTGALLPLYPLLEYGYILPGGIIIDAKTGVSGGGKNPKQAFHYPERTENFQAYKVGTHRHTPEITDQLNQAYNRSAKEHPQGNTNDTLDTAELIFTPHLTSMSRGIFSTIYANISNKAEGMQEEAWLKLFQDYYCDSHFVNPIQNIPETKWVSGTNSCLISVKPCPKSGKIVLMSAIDNLVKGASGQAVQNMNLMLGLKETMGLGRHPNWP